MTDWCAVLGASGPEGATKLAVINENKDNDEFNKLGGVSKLFEAMGSSAGGGLSDEKIEASRAQHGANRFKAVPPKSFMSILIEQLKDPTLILLMCAATVSTVLGAAIPEEREENGYIEGIAIWIAVGIVSLVGAGNDFQKDKQFRKLNDQKDAIEVTCIRNGEEQLVLNSDLVVGDLVVLNTGDKLVADGVFVSGHDLTIDEASLTGESDPIKKSDTKLWMRSGTQVTEGNGKMLVTAVGEQSEWGMTLAHVVKEAEDTPLQEKLADLAGAIGKVGFTVAVAAFLILTIRWMADNKGFAVKKINTDGPVQFFLYGVTIVVMAVPEGLPLAVTISMAYSMKKMLQDNNFVRVLAACETMGGATAICSDKTGTLTENRMTVVQGWFSGAMFGKRVPKKEEIPEFVAQETIVNICLNSTAFLVEEEGKQIEFVGNRTECALLVLAKKEWGEDYAAYRHANESRVAKVYGFSSAKKMASVLVKMPDGTFRLYNKGAAEYVVEACKSWHDEAGNVQPMTQAKKDELVKKITGMASKGLRTLCLSYRDFPPGLDVDSEEFAEAPDESLTALCIVGIKDPVRKEVPDAVETCKNAGICVRMVTGDNIHTARHIARECGILWGDGLALEGPEFRVMPDEAIIELLPKLQVLARSSPTDKHKLVNLLKRQGQVVAVTGDGTNDAPALKESDVGLAMGIAGTEVAKEAADIVILDDNFTSIVKSVLWGRTVFGNIRKFLQFQLTVNLVALIIAFIGAFVQKEPLNVLQLLWVNLIMDTMAALALATEPPHLALLDQKPHGREAPLISSCMWKHIWVMGIYQAVVMLIIMFALPEFIDDYKLRSRCEVADDFMHEVAEELAEVAEELAESDSVSTHDLQLYSYLTSGTFLLFEPSNAGGWIIPGADGHCASVAQPRVQHFCPTSEADSCSTQQRIAYDHAYDVWGDWKKLYEDEHEHDEGRSLSLLFNAFIFMQVFNEFNARKILDEYNVFEGFFKNTIFIGVMVITCLLQVVIVMTPVNQFFHVNSLNGVEWAVSIAFGAGVLPLSALTRWISRLLGISPALLLHTNQNTGGQSHAAASSAEGASKVVDPADPTEGAQPLMDGANAAANGV